jgi:long-chain acyl-CoA synthetase
MILTRFQEMASHYPDRIAVQFKESDRYVQHTYRSLLQQVASVARSLSEKGVKKGDRVAILSENRPEWIVAYLAVVSFGAVVVPLDAQFMEKEVALLLASSGAKAVFVSSACRQKLPGNFPHAIITFDPEEDFLFSSMSKAYADASIPPCQAGDVLAAILYTSGTTGDPKGVMLSQSNLASNLDSILKLNLFDHRDNFLCILPLHHTYSAIACMFLPLALGAKVTILNSLKGPEILSCIQEMGVSVLVGVPQLFTGLRRAIFDEIEKKPAPLRLLVKLLLGFNRLVRRFTGVNLGKPLFKAVHAKFGPQFRLGASGGARLEPDVHRDMTDIGFWIIEGYGLTETSPLCTFNLMKPGSIGIPIPGVEVRIADPDANGQGELAVRGPNVMLGYYKKPEETAAVLKDGWFFTGDLGYRDKDGYFFITGRSKEMIVLSTGKKIFPEELEKVFKQIPAIKEICLIQAERGLEAVVVPDFDYLRRMNLSNSRETIAAEIEDLSRDLPPYQHIRGLKIFKDPLPVTRLGKLRRSLVRELYQRGGERAKKVVREIDDALLKDPVAQKLMVCLEPFSAKKKIVSDDNLELDLGFDSLGRVELIVGIEETFGISLPDSFGSEVFTVKDIVLKLKELLAGPMKTGERVQRSWANILAQEPSADLRALFPVERGFLRNTALYLFKQVLNLTFRIYGRLSVRGTENLPAQGPYIIAPNHLSLADAPAVIARIPWKIVSQTFFLGTTQYFAGIISARIAKLIHVIPVDVDARLHGAMQMSAHVLRRGNILCVFPEGSRSRDGSIKDFKKGVGILAKELNVPLVPVAITGTYEMLAPGMRFPRLSKIRVSFGKPLHPGDLDYDGIVKKLREEVIVMLEEDRKKQKI